MTLLSPLSLLFLAAVPVIKTGGGVMYFLTKKIGVGAKFDLAFGLPRDLQRQRTEAFRARDFVQ